MQALLSRIFLSIYSWTWSPVLLWLMLSRARCVDLRAKCQLKRSLYRLQEHVVLIKCEGRIGEYQPEVLTVQTELSEVHTIKTEGRYSPWPVPFRASLFNKIFITRRSYSKNFKSDRAGSFETLYGPILREC